jgi:hypothetical protein
MSEDIVLWKDATVALAEEAFGLCVSLNKD